MYDGIMPDDIREKARLERVRTKEDSSLLLSTKALCIVAMNDAVVLKRTSEQLNKRRAAREAKRARLLDGVGWDGSDSEAHVEGDDDGPDESYAIVPIYSVEDDLHDQKGL